MRLLALVLAFAFTPAQAAETPTDRARREASNHLTSCEVAEASRQGECKREQARFIAEYVKAKAGQSTAQQNVSTFLSPTALREPALGINYNAIQACAWMFVNVAFGHPDTSDLEYQQLKNRCGRLEPGEQAIARSRAAALLTDIKATPARAPVEPAERPSRRPLDGTAYPLQPR